MAENSRKLTLRRASTLPKKKMPAALGLRRLCEASALTARVPIVCQIFARKPDTDSENTYKKKKKYVYDYKNTRAFLVRTPLPANTSTSKSGPMSRSFRPFWDFKFVGLFYREGFKLY